MIDSEVGLNKDIQFYKDRLANIQAARVAIDAPGFFIQYWGDVPILKTDKQKGLKFGMDHAILGSMRMLRALGEAEEKGV